MKETEETDKKYVFQDLDWLNKNAFADTDGDFWRHQEDAKSFSDGDFWRQHKKAEMISAEDIGKVFDKKDLIVKNIEWIVKMIVTKETHPEYFL